MLRGTTPTHVFKTNIDLSDAEVIFITYKQQGKILVEKTIDDVTLTAEEVSVKLTQEDTLAFDEHSNVKLQIRARFADGTAVACPVIERPVGDILKEGEI